MTKNELTLKVSEAIIASNDKSVTKKILGEVISAIMVEYSLSSSSKDEHPNIIKEDGSVDVWCLKHLKYEDSSEFAVVPKSKNGYHNKCKVADYQWRDYLAKIKEVEVKLSVALDNEKYEDAKIHNEEKKYLTTEKDNAYSYPNEEEILRITPKSKNK